MHADDDHHAYGREPAWLRPLTPLPVGHWYCMSSNWCTCFLSAHDVL